MGRSGGVQGDRTDHTKTAQQKFARFGITWHRKVHFSIFSGKLTFQSTRNGSQNPPFCPGSLQDSFIIYSSISHQHIFRTYCWKRKNENRKSENLKFQKPRFTNKCAALSTHSPTPLPQPFFTRLLLVNLQKLGFSQKLVFSIF